MRTEGEMLILASLSCEGIWVVLSAHCCGTICSLSARGFPEGPLICLAGIYLGAGGRGELLSAGYPCCHPSAIRK